MKKLFIVLVGLLTAASCCSVSDEEYRNRMHEHDQLQYQEHSRVYTITATNEDGVTETHEFLFIGGSHFMSGIDHWPGCKYCKNKR